MLGELIFSEDDLSCTSFFYAKAVLDGLRHSVAEFYGDLGSA